MRSDRRQRSELSIDTLIASRYLSNMSFKIWLRVKLPDKELAALKQSAPQCELRQGDDDAAMDPRWISGADGVFTEAPLPDALVQQIPNLNCLHLTPAPANPH